MSTETPPMKDNKAGWNATRDTYLVEQLIHQQNIGRRAQSVWSKEAWKDVLNSFNSRFKTSYDLLKLKNRLTRFQENYFIMKDLIEHGGFEWDPSSGLITADNETWDQYIEAHPKAKYYRDKTCPLYQQLGIIFEGEHADTSGEKLVISPTPVNYIITEETEIVHDGTPCIAEIQRDTDFTQSSDEDIPSETPMLNNFIQPLASQNSERAGWDATRDAFLVEQLLCQQGVGKRQNATWSKEAWRDTLNAFNARFRTSYDIRKLKNRLSRLREDYFIVKELIERAGFQWDPHSGLVTADSLSWEQYIKANPKVKSYRDKVFPLYEKLAKIYEGTAFGGASLIFTIHHDALNNANMPADRRITPGVAKKQAEKNSTPIFNKEIPIETPIQNQSRAQSSSNHQGPRKRSYNADCKTEETSESHVSCKAKRVVSKEPEVVREDYSYHQCLKELQQLEGLEVSEIVRGAHALKDEQNRIAFTVLKGAARLAFLRSCFK